MIVAELAARLGLKVDKGAWAEGTKRIGAMQVALGLLVAQGVRRAASALKDLTIGMADYADALVDAGRKSGVSTQFLESLAFAAGGTQENLGKVTDAATKMSIQLREALVNKTGPAAKALKELGLSLDDPRVKLGDVEGVMRVMAERFENMADGSVKNSLSMRLMGKSGTEMSQVLSELSEKTEAFNAAGGPTRQKDLDALNRAKDGLEKVAQGWLTVKVRAAAFIFPKVEEAIKSVSAWYDEHKETVERVYNAVRDTVTEVVNELGESWDAAFEDVRKFVEEHRESLTTFFEAVGTVGKIAFAGIVIAVKILIRAIGVIAIVVGGVIDAFIKAGVWIGETLAKVVLFFAEVGKLGSKIGDAFVAVGKGIEAVWKRIIGWIEKKVGWVVDKVEWISDKLGLGDDSGIAPQDAFLQGFRGAQTPTPRDAFLSGFQSTSRPPANGNTSQTIQGAEVTVNVTPTPGMDPISLAKLIATKTKEVLDMQLRSAQETLVTVGG